MREGRTPRERLRKANPVDPNDMPAPDSPAPRALLDRIVTSGPGRQARGRPRRRPYVRVLVPVALLGAIAAGYGIFSEVRQPLIGVCFEEADVKADRAVVSVSSRELIKACAALWEPGGPFHAAGAAVPPLTDCVLGSGAVAVFPVLPGKDTCAELGLAPPAEPGGAGDGAAIVQLQEALSGRFLASCVGEEEALALVRQEFERLRLADWRVVVPRPFGGEACASVAIDPARRVVELVPIPPP
jgi:hypothetical protein